ncbi:hypothetical protein [Salinilacihabitans rarus]|uniref:hypothetical protein n=1 Tax=Salinilacihabitans rarus TaxID=2961596 RepID=UPI0020C88055|nr:hypothetical protein [Salinilacihabitans rarus]
MSTQLPPPGQRVTVEFGPRTVEGVVDDVRWRPSFNASDEQIVVDAGAATITADPGDVRPR